MCFVSLLFFNFIVPNYDQPPLSKRVGSSSQVSRPCNGSHVVARPATLALPGPLLETFIRNLLPKPTESEPAGWGPAICD